MQQQLGIEVVSRAGGGNVYDKDNRIFYLDTTTTGAEQDDFRIRTLWDFSLEPPKGGPDATKVSRDQYIQQHLDRLTDFYSAQAVFGIEQSLKSYAGGPALDPAKVQPLYWEAYLAGYGAVPGWLVNDEAARAGGRQAVFNAIKESNRSMSLGQEWDAAQSAPKRSWKCAWLWKCS
ncbi:hypothetical protein [Actinomadura sp. HBU206391]|uniref:hypothetical protein n=1 Tax=Actinomadura sp. HBU206391 TaxID=2731692 RepID=UPI001C9C3E09|nr:hypothetical protein [Actinomadura sp. HBU206391]